MSDLRGGGITAGLRLALFACGMALLFGGGYALGGAIDPDPGTDSGPVHTTPHDQGQ